MEGKDIIMIRKAVPADIPAIQAVAQVAWEHTYRDIMRENTRRQFLAEFYTTEALGSALNMAPGGVWVAEEDDSVIGFVQVVPMLGKPGLELTRLYVLPEKQRSGVGQALLDEIQKQFVGNALWALVEIDDGNSVAFYEKNSFAKRRSISLNLYGEELKFVEFRRDLRD